MVKLPYTPVPLIPVDTSGINNSEPQFTTQVKQAPEFNSQYSAEHERKIFNLINSWSVKTLLIPQRLEGETFDEYKFRRKFSNKYWENREIDPTFRTPQYFQFEKELNEKKLNETK